MKSEHIFILIVGLLILTYVLDAVANPLSIVLTTPYHYFNTKTMLTYAFTSTSIILKSVVLFITPLLLLSFIGLRKTIEGLILLVLSGFMQLYSLQSVLTHSYLIPLEWSLSLTLAGMFLLIPTIFYLIVGLTQKVHKKLTDPYSDDTQMQEKTWEDK
ncbi:MAG: hypothetical protein COU25_02585 [Candidatus Levybacteria bacterium CG10_big_fil_rev_8_21_14_0_10_35_13]|nr:MAG: hypothetical protein COU25_02585 [Candidatus Levybacteria bacterium CG10_big_fil_rev_8_21_14_0_10_35_13]